MIDITFDKFKELYPCKHLTLKEISIEICGTERLYGFLSKLATRYPVAIAGNYKEVDDYMSKFGYHLIVDTNYNNARSNKDKRIEELEDKLAFAKERIAYLERELMGCSLILQGARLICSAQESERLVKRPRKHSRKRGE